MTDRDDPSDTPPSAFLGTDVRTHKPVYLPYGDRPRGVSIIGKAGTGKSTLLEHIVHEDIKNRIPGLIIDPHGLFAHRLMLNATEEEAKSIILLEADQSAPFGLNLLDVREPIDKNDDPVTWASDSVVATVKKLFGNDSQYFPRLERWLDVPVRTLIPNNGTLADVVRLFRNEDFRRQCLKNVDDPSIHEDWSEYDSLRATDQITYIEAVVNRLGRMLRPPLLQSIIGSKKTTVPFDDILYGDKTLLISLPSEKLSQERCDFIGSLALHVFTNLVFTRKVSIQEPPRVHVVVDEYQRIASSTTNALIEQGRKYGVGLTMAHQTLQQIPDLRIRSASHQTGTLLVLSVPRRDAEELAGEFPVTPTAEWIERIEDIDGEEPVLVPIARPVEHLFTTPHSDDLTDQAARLLLVRGKLQENAYPPMPPTPGRDPITGIRGMISHPGGSFYTEDRIMRSVPDDIRISHPINPRLHDELNAFLVRAMNHEFEDPEPLADALVQNGLFYRHCGDYIYYVYSDDGRDERDLLFSEGFGPWIADHLAHREELKEDRWWVGQKTVDERFTAFARSRGWRRIQYWEGTPTERELEPEPSLKPDPGGTLIKLTNDLPIDQYLDALLGPDGTTLMKIRERLQWLVILCDGISEKPILVPSGQMRPRGTTRYVHHAKQAEQDARNEFAAKLVNPKRKHVAHVKLLSGYHETLLRPPPDEEGVNARTPNPDQPDEIRSRSRALYDASAHQGDAHPHVSPQELPKRNITRRSRPQDTETEE